MSDQRDGGIAWTEETWNPIRGCSRVSEGCRHCYAETMAARFSGPGQPYEGLARSTPSGPRWTGKVRLVEEHLADPLRWKRPRRIFVNSMSDLFHEALSNEQIAAIFGVMAAAPQHTFQVLTKRAKRMREWFAWAAAHGTGTEEDIVTAMHRHAWTHREVPRLLRGNRWPPTNIWLGVSVEDQRTADERIPHLLETPAAVRWVSYEPAIGPVDLRGFLRQPIYSCQKCDAEEIERDSRGRHAYCGGSLDPSGMTDDGLDWIVIGGESGDRARVRAFDVAWARSLIEACKAAGVACFVKQLGARPIKVGSLLRDRKGADPAEWPEDLRVREWPSAEGAR